MFEAEAAVELKDLGLPFLASLGELTEEPGYENNFLLPDGVQSVIKSLASELPDEVISLNERVTNIDWTNDEKVVVTTEGGTHTAHHVIVTIPLGVLKANHKELFTPHLNNEKIKSIENIGFGNVAKLFLEWDQPWWKEYEMIVTGKRIFATVKKY